ncbi:MAG: TetR/AcrR family transcriptional regulator [Bacteroidales bacterium]|nr:TetR/AcrR family transcriptional regulator [Bacteroidales bacterium]
MPRSKIQNEKVKDERREQILSGALSLFASKGLSATRISDISAKTGMSQGLVYHYFPSKEAIFVKLISDALEKMNEAAMNLEQMEIPAEMKVRLVVKGLLEGLIHSPATSDYYFLMTQTALSESFPAEARELIRRENDVKYQIMTRIFGQGQVEGTVKKTPARELATILFSLVNGLALNKAYYREHFILPDLKPVLGIFLVKP